MRYNTSIGTEEGYEKRQQIRDTDINIHFQFGISMLVPIFLCSILGVWLGNLTGINWLMIPFFFMGALAGFTNIYKTVRKLYRQEERKKTMLKRINEALPGLVVSILLYGVMVELIGVWFVKDRIAYSIGGMVWHSGCRGDGNQSCNCDL